MFVMFVLYAREKVKNTDLEYLAQRELWLE